MGLKDILNSVVDKFSGRKGYMENNKEDVEEKKEMTIDELIISKSNEMQIDPKLMRAFIKVESGGYHIYNGRLVINYETHIFQRLTNGLVIPDENIIPSDFLNQQDEYRNFQKAKAINEEMAYRSISMGSTQIMGFHFAILGYKTAKEMYDSFSKSENAAIEGFCKFVLSKNSLLMACRNKDFHLMAYYYNGASYQIYKDVKGRTYADKIKECYLS